MAVSRLDLQFEDLVTLGPFSLRFEEKMDPHGIPSVSVTMWVPCNLFDSARRGRTRPNKIHMVTMERTLREWLDGGQEQIVEAVREGLKEIIVEFQGDINAMRQ